MNRSFATLATAALLALGIADAGAATTYRIKDLGTTPQGWASQGLAINDSNVVVGWVQTHRNGPHVAAMWTPDGTLQTIGAPAGDDESYANAVNARGQIVGFGGTYDAPHAFLWDPVTGMQSLGAFDAAHPSSTAQGISDDGTVVGVSTTAAGLSHAFTWTAATGLVDPYPAAQSAQAWAINAHDQWVGGVSPDENSQTALRVNAHGKATNLGLITTDSPFAYGKAINGAGKVVGSAGATDGTNHAFLWDKLHGMQDLGVLPGGDFSNALAINDAGVVVGVSDQPAGRGTADAPFYYDKRGGMVDLDTLIAADDPLKGSVTFDAAQSINNRGIIVANGLITLPNIANPRYRAFLLIPVTN